MEDLEDSLDECIDESVRTLDQMCFSSQYYMMMTVLTAASFLPCDSYHVDASRLVRRGGPLYSHTDQDNGIMMDTSRLNEEMEHRGNARRSTAS